MATPRPAAASSSPNAKPLGFSSVLWRLPAAQAAGSSRFIGQPMKIILVGAEGDVGRSAYNELSTRHEIITVGRSTGQIRVDISDRSSIDVMYKQAGRNDALMCAAGEVHFGPL